MLCTVTNWDYLDYSEDVNGELVIGEKSQFSEAVIKTSNFTAFLPGDVAFRVEIYFHISNLQKPVNNDKGSNIFFGIVHTFKNENSSNY